MARAQSQSHKQRVKRQSGSINTSNTSSSNASGCELYTFPAAGDSITAYTPVNITWDCSCLGAGVSEIDLTLYGGQALHAWTHVPCPANTFQTQFIPSWWNGSLSESLQLQITQSDQPVWATTTGIGPQFTVSWNGTVPVNSAKNGTSTEMSVESVRNDDTGGGVTGGKLAAAVVVPLLAAAIGVAAYVFYSRRKGRTERKRWSAYVDNRMSHYSTAQASMMDPPSGSPGRPSMSMHGHSARPSLAGRPISTASFGANSGNFAGVGSNKHTPAASFSAAAHSRAQSGSGRPTSSFYALDGHSFIDTPPPSAELAGRSRPMGTGHGDRVSRVSFAESAYTSGHAKRPSSFFATGAVSSPNAHKSKLSIASIPAMPRMPANAATGYETSDLATGVDDRSAHSLSSEEVARLGGGKGSKNSSPSKNGSKKHNITVSTSMPFLGNIGGRQSIMSPDDLMKAYAYKAHQPAERPDTVYTEASKYGEEQQEEVVRSSEEGDAPRKGKFGGKFGFGFAK